MALTFSFDSLTKKFRGPILDPDIFLVALISHLDHFVGLPNLPQEVFDTRFGDVLKLIAWERFVVDDGGTILSFLFLASCK